MHRAESDIYEAVKGRRVIVRVDHNAPIDGGGGVRDASRLQSGLEVLRRLSEVTTKLIVLTHRGDPEDGESLSLRTCFDWVAPHLYKAGFCPDPAPASVRLWIEEHPELKTIYVENVRHLPGEKHNDYALAKAWSELADVYVADAFSVVHRGHTSVALLPKTMTSYAGPTLMRNLHELEAVLVDASRVGILVAGAKASTKLPAASRLSEMFDVVCVAGLCGAVALEKELQREAPKLILPLDFVCVTRSGLEVRDRREQKHINNIVDTGPRTLESFLALLSACDVLVWNGPLGEYESMNGRASTRSFLNALAEGPSRRFIAGGGDTLAALTMLGYKDTPTLLVPAGGAMLDYLCFGWELPGLAPLKNARAMSTLRASCSEH